MSDPDTLATIVPMHHRPATREAQAYCGAAHGQQWPVTEATPPAWVELPTGATTALYRLVRNPRTARPARDHLGRYLYVPMTGHHRALTEPASQVLAFPADRLSPPDSDPA